MQYRSKPALCLHQATSLANHRVVFAITLVNILALITCRVYAFHPTTLGLHLATWHDQGQYEAITPGLYARWPQGLTAGVVRNSEGGTSFYVGRSWHTNEQAPLSLSLTAGVITGYRNRSVLPLLIPSALVRVGERWGLRLLALPKIYDDGANSVSTTLEYHW